MSRANNFDALRLIAALAVLLSHMAALGGESVWLVHGQNWGTIGVLVFFSISGYLVLASWRSDPNIGRFFERRFLRIAPALVIVMPLTFGVAKAVGLYGFPDNPIHFLNGSLWTIEYEVVMYLMLPAAAMFTRRPALVGVALLLATVAAFDTYVIMTETAYFAFFGTAFVVGMLLQEYPALRRWSWAFVAFGAAIFPLHPLAFPLIIAPLAVAIGTQSWPVLRSAGKFGDLSYGVYIWAWPIQQFVVAIMGHEANYFALLAVVLPLVLLAAWASWRYIEAPALARKPVRRIPDEATAPDPIAVTASAQS